MDAIGLVVKDLGESVKFYRLVGVEFADPGESPHHEVTLPNGLRLMLDTEELVKEIDPDWKRPEGQAMGMAFHCETASGVDSVFKKVIDAGYKGKMDPWDAFWGQRYAQVLDPDGNSVDLFAPLEK